MVYKKEPVKTDAEWEVINFRNSLGPQIGGLIHDAVAISTQLYTRDAFNRDGFKDDIQYWLDTLYEIAEQKKSQILKDQEPKPLTEEDFKRAKEKYEKIEEVERQKEVVGLQDANYEANEVAEEDNKSRVPF